jgi:hypothetical protein
VIRIGPAGWSYKDWEGIVYLRVAQVVQVLSWGMITGACISGHVRLQARPDLLLQNRRRLQLAGEGKRWHPMDA